MAKGSCKIIGLERIDKNLEILKTRAPQRLAKLVQDSLETLSRLAKIWAPRKSGEYLESIQVRMGEKGEKTYGFVAPWSGKEGRISRVGHLIEFGTAPHATGKGSERVVTTGHSLQVTESGKKRWTRVLGTGRQTGRMHPGTPAKPHLFPAFQIVVKQLKADIVTAIRETGAFR